MSSRNNSYIGHEIVTNKIMVTLKMYGNIMLVLGALHLFITFGLSSLLLGEKWGVAWR